MMTMIGIEEDVYYTSIPLFFSSLFFVFLFHFRTTHYAITIVTVQLSETVWRFSANLSDLGEMMKMLKISSTWFLRTLW